MNVMLKLQDMREKFSPLPPQILSLIGGENNLEHIRHLQVLKKEKSKQGLAPSLPGQHL